MSFGFSIGDIILVSQLAYDLYSTVSSGRQAASRDLRELEEVLFSLRCALDHLKEVSHDVLTRPGLPDGDELMEKLGMMISSCASTLQELDTVTKKYRLVEMEAGKEKTSLRTLEDVKKSIRVNWQRVRWDREKQWLQQYREKLKSHTDAINLILTSVVWETVTSASESSKKNHEKTHSLLSEVLRNPAVDAGFRAMVQEIHAVLIKPSPKPEEVQMEAIPSTGLAYNEPNVTASSLIGSIVGESSGPTEIHERRLPSVSIHAMSALPYRTSRAIAYARDPSGEASTQEVGGATLWKGQTTAESALRREYPTGHGNLSIATIQLNSERRAFGAKEFKAFKQRHAQPKKVSKPSFLTSVAPTSQELQACIPHIFRSTVDGKQETQELKNEITRWTHEFSRFVNDTKASQADEDRRFLTLLGALNEAVESSTGRMRQLFYDISHSAGFTSVLNQVETVSKSARVKKGIEDFQADKEDWEEHSRSR